MSKPRIELNEKSYPPCRFLICGIREWPYYFPVLMIVGGLKKRFGDDIVIIEGEARGVDKFARQAAVDLGLEFDPYPADWKKYGRYGPSNAGAMRNQQMLDEGKPDRVIAIGSGSGTNDMVKRGHDAGLLVIRRYKEYSNASFT